MAVSSSMQLTFGDGREVEPALVGGFLAAHRPTFSASGSRIFVPVGSSAFCYSVKTSLQTGALETHDGKVTAVIGGPALKDDVEPICSGSDAGEIRLWDAKTLAQLGSLKLDAAVVALRWPRPDTVIAVVRQDDDKVEVRQIDVTLLGSPKEAAISIPLRADKFGAFDAAVDTIAITDGSELCIWVDGWTRCVRYPHKDVLSTVSVDLQRRYVTVGDAEGVIFTWWGILDSQEMSSRRTPGKFHWHANIVRTITHCGPIVISGGEEGVMVYRRTDTDTPQYIPRFPGPLKHIVASDDGHSICVSVGNNSLAIINDLHNWVRPRYINGLATPPKGSSESLRTTGLRRSVLHPLMWNGGVAVTGGDLSVQFLDSTNQVMLSETLELRKPNNTKDRSQKNPQQRWTLWQICFGCSGVSLMTVERRLSPALNDFDPETAESYVVKWWRRASTGDEFTLDSLSNNAHTKEITVALAHPQRENYFVTASLDGTFKCWDWLPTGATEEEATEKSDSKQNRCWQCVAIGNWHSRQILSGSFCMDGSVLALGFNGFIVLWDPDKVTELHTAALADGATVPYQLSFTMACGRFLLLACTRTNDKEHLLCWDLACLQPVASLDLDATVWLQAGVDKHAGALAGIDKCEVGAVVTDKQLTKLTASSSKEAAVRKAMLKLKEVRVVVPGEGRLAVRVSRPSPNSNSLDLLAYREEVSDRPAALVMLRLAASSAGGSLAFKQVASARLPSGRCVRDAVFVGGDAKRVLCWLSDFDLLDLDLLAGKEQSLTQLAERAANALAEEKAPAAKGKLARIVGGRTAATPANQGQRRRLFAPMLRTTAAQQAGILTRLLSRVLPAHVPSHLLPPPSVMWAGLLTVFGKPPPGVEAPLALENEAVQPAEAGATDLRAGLTVVIGGMNKELNGTEAICEEWIESKGRWNVRLKCGTVKGLKPENLKASTKSADSSPLVADVASATLGVAMPPWIAPDAKGRSELVDVDWMDQLVQEALAK